jgi:membrane protease subunit HflK
MINIIGWGARLGALFNENKGSPWGSGGGGSGDGDGPRSPWGGPPRRRRPSGGGNPLDELLRRGRDRFGGGFPPTTGRPWWLYLVGAIVVLVAVFTSFHLIGQRERGVITRFGKYAGTLQPGIGTTFPWPIDSVHKVNVGEIRQEQMGSTDPNANDFVLTGDKNLIDVAYQVNWRIRDPELYLFQMAEPEQTIHDVAQFAMRAVVSRVSLNDAIGSGRADIEQRVTLAMQQVLDQYRSGIEIDNVAIKQSDPPQAVNDAFKSVSAAQQDAQSDINNARSYASQITAKAQGDATAFDKVYAQYKLAPEVTRRRMYYDTMEDVLSHVDKTVIEAPGVTPYLPLPEVRAKPRQEPTQ